jgi:hypothetical protein
MGILTISQDITKPTTEREERAANKLLAAALQADAETVERMLTKNRTILALVDRGVLKVSGIMRRRR